jgi:hypothetical protein
MCPRNIDVMASLMLNEAKCLDCMPLLRYHVLCTVPNRQAVI